MDRFLDYELKLKAYFQKREATLRKIKNLEFMLLSSLSRFCIATGTSMEMLFAMLEGRECKKEFDSFTQILSLATIMKTVDALREERISPNVNYAGGWITTDPTSRNCISARSLSTLSFY